MLEFIRKRAQGFFAWLIVGGIIITFALFGVNDYFSGGGDNSVAKVDGQGISQVELEQAYLQQRQRLEQMFGGELPAAFSEKMIRQQALSQLVAREVMVQAALANDMRVSDGQLAEIIRSVDAFHEDGAFSRSRYEQLLRNQGMTPKSFEARIRRDILAAQFEGGFRDTVLVTPNEVDNLLRLQKQQRTVGYLRVALAPFEESASVSDAEVEEFYQENLQRFMQPERVKVDYLELNAEELSAGVEVDEDTLRSYYEAQKINYSTPEERQASHILIQADESASRGELDEAKERAQALLERLRQGEDFAELAKSESQDPGSAPQGGDLGFFGRGDMVPEFEEAAFALGGEGALSEVVQSPFGFHIIKLTAVRGGEVKPFDEVKEKILADVRLEQASQQFYDMAEQLANLTYEHPDSLQLASEELQLPVKSSDYFTREGGEGIAANPKVTAAAFSDDVLIRGNNSETVELGRNHLVVLRINDHRPEAAQPLQEVREAIFNHLKREKARIAAQALAEELLQKLRAGETPQDLAAAAEVSWHEGRTLERDDNAMDRNLLEQAFRLPAPEQEATSSSVVAMGSGDQAVVVLYDVVDGDPAAASDEEREQMRNQLLQAETSAVSEALMSGVRSRMDITIKQ